MARPGDLHGRRRHDIRIQQPGVASVSASGVVTAVANGEIAVTARHDDAVRRGGLTVSISGGIGFLRGEAYDDSKGLPLAQCHGAACSATAAGP